MYSRLMQVLSLFVLSVRYLSRQEYSELFSTDPSRIKKLAENTRVGAHDSSAVELLT